jgi:hypothetical protein
MLKSLKSILGATLVAGTLAVGAYAQDRQNTPAQGGMPQGSQTDHDGMMQNGMKPQGGMMGMMNMMGQMDPAQMNRMMENCNKMMESTMQSPPSGTTPQPKG